MGSGKPRLAPTQDVAARLVEISRRLSREVDAMTFGGKVAFVYNPLAYAEATHDDYLRRYGRHKGITLLIGMNPGPFGMAQTGVPFGEVAAVRDFLGVRGDIGAPATVHPKRPVLGFDCARSEVSGRRLWGWASERYGDADRFFERFLVWNFCPLVFMVESGANLTPDKLTKQERATLYAACERALVDVVEATAAGAIVGIGKFAEKRARECVPDFAGTIGSILHPSPASPAANRGWQAQAEAQLAALGLD